MTAQRDQSVSAYRSAQELELQRWVDLRRAVLSIVAAIHRVIPQGTHTLDVQIVPRDQSAPMSYTDRDTP